MIARLRALAGKLPLKSAIPTVPAFVVAMNPDPKLIALLGITNLAAVAVLYLAYRRRK